MTKVVYNYLIEQINNYLIKLKTIKNNYTNDLYYMQPKLQTTHQECLLD